jgi:protease I
MREGAAEMAMGLQGTTVAFLVATEGIEQVELTHPWGTIREAGGTPRLVSTEAGRVQAFHHLDRADTFPVDDVVDDVTARDFTGLVLPGGVANPDQLRTNGRAVAFVKEFFTAGLPVAAICHAPWTVVEADEAAGRTLTSYPSLRTDILNAGGTWKDEELVVCDAGANTLITSRTPADLEAFSGAVRRHFAS